MRGGAEPVAPVRLHVTRHGSQGPPLLLIHGFGASGFCWRHWVPALSRSHRVWVLDLRGFGSSPKPRDGRYSPHDHARDVLALVRDQDLAGLTLVGHSLGGGISLLVALRLLDAGEMERLRGLVLVAGAAYPQPLPPFISLARHPTIAAVLLGLVPMRLLSRWILEAIVYDKQCVTEEMVEGYSRQLAGRHVRHALVETARNIVPEDLSALVDRFPELDLPVQLLWGDHDRVVPPWVGRRLRDALPRATLDVLPACGHLPAEERPEVSLNTVTHFLEALPASP